eukprot:2889669-Pleurochrysis_carterae.AAC.2
MRTTRPLRTDCAARTASTASQPHAEPRASCPAARRRDRGRSGCGRPAEPQAIAANFPPRRHRTEQTCHSVAPNPCSAEQASALRAPEKQKHPLRHQQTHLHARPRRRRCAPPRLAARASRSAAHSRHVATAPQPVDAPQAALAAPSAPRSPLGQTAQAARRRLLVQRRRAKRTARRTQTSRAQTPSLLAEHDQSPGAAQGSLHAAARSQARRTCCPCRPCVKLRCPPRAAHKHVRTATAAAASRAEPRETPATAVSPAPPRAATATIEQCCPQASRPPARATALVTAAEEARPLARA